MSENHNEQVKVWEESVIIPTYRIGKPNKNPMFLEKRVYQGSSGVVYPHPVIDSVYDEKEDKQYSAIFLENRYLKIMLLPEIGGRVQMALDKTNGYHFVYYNRVIKPALVGLTGPWISGGIEFNWPQHHRPSTFEPVDWFIQTNDDGSQTVWLSEIERMFRTRGMAGFTIYPNRAYLEIKVQLYNRTSQPQTFLWWANPAVHVNEDYQSVFPPDVHAVMDHGKRDVSDFPIATGTYYKVDYAPGTDISRYKNIPVPTSFMADHSDFDFLGCYDHGKKAGMMHIANHHVVPGKKQWTWGNSDFGKAWDRQLTDEDGPYIELMCGAYTDNQPDFSWLQPGEEKWFTQYFMPYKLTGGAKNANQEAVINLEVEDDIAALAVYVTRPRHVCIQLLDENRLIFEQAVDLTPETAFLQDVHVPPNTRPSDLKLRLLVEGQELIAFTPLPHIETVIPQPAMPVSTPEDIPSNDELFLSGLHLEQYRHATYEPEPYFLEALRRDPYDSRCNNAMGRLLFRRGKFADAEAYFRKAIDRLTLRNPNPYDGEPFYNLGLALKMQGRYEQARDAFYKAVWNAAYQDSAYFELARLACRAGRLQEALELADRALSRNAHYHQARHLKVALLRHLGRLQEAQDEASASLKLDCLNLGVLYEQSLLLGQDKCQALMGAKVHTTIEISLDYAHAGLFGDAIDLLNSAPTTDPMAKYFVGWYHCQDNNPERAQAAFKAAAQMPPDYCFPNELECVPALECAIRRNPGDSRAPYYLGNFWYAHRRYAEAINSWEQARTLDPYFPTLHRNLGLGYANKQGDLQKALAAYLDAFNLDPTDARVFFELDQLYNKLNELPEQRLKRLEQHIELVHTRDDLTLEYVTLLNVLGQHEQALGILLERHFHPWEGGEGKVTRQYVLSLVELAKQKLKMGDFIGAVDSLERAQVYPPNLGEGKLPGAQENSIFYYLGCAHAGLGATDIAHAYFERASVGQSEPASALYYNDQPPDMFFYAGKALQKLGLQDEALANFLKLIDYGMQHLKDHVSIDYFAVSLPDFLIFDEDLNRRNQIHCRYMMGLGYLGLGDLENAESNFEAVLRLKLSHIGATIHRKLLIEPQDHNPF